MSYLLDRKIKQKKFLRNTFFVLIFLFLFYFRTIVFNTFSAISLFVFRPVLIGGNYVGEKFNSLGSYLSSKNFLYLENENLKSKIDTQNAHMANYRTLLFENEDLKKLLGRKKVIAATVLSLILSKPNQSVYDTLVIDAGKEEDVQVGNLVMVLGEVPMGRIREVYSHSSKVVLFSNSGEKTQVLINKNIFMTLVGRGGGNFEMVIPKDFVLNKGDEVTLAGIIPRVVGIVQMTISDPRDLFTKALLTTPANILELKFVEVEL